MADPRTQHYNLPLIDPNQDANPDGIEAVNSSITAIENLIKALSDSKASKAELQQIIGAAPAALDTLEEIATRLQSGETVSDALVAQVSSVQATLTQAVTDLADKAEKSSVKILAVHVFEHANRVALSNASERKLFGGNFNKISDTSKIVATCTVFGAAYAGGISGVGMVLDDAWDFGCGYQYDGAWNASQTTIVIGTSDFGVVLSGAKRIDFGWKTNNGIAERPFSYLCPNQSDDARNPQTVSRIVVYEIEV